MLYLALWVINLNFMSLSVNADVIALKNNCSDPTDMNKEGDRKIRCSALISLLFSTTIIFLIEYRNYVDVDFKIYGL